VSGPPIEQLIRELEREHAEHAARKRRIERNHKLRLAAIVLVPVLAWAIVWFLR